MELIERYLQAFRNALPRAQQDDVTKELRDNLLSQVEEREEAAGRPLTEEERVELLKKLGSPTRLASGYRRQDHLIGSIVFPIYWKILMLTLGLSFLSLAAASVALAAAGKTLGESLSVLLSYPRVALSVFGWVTLTFAALEFFGTKLQFRDNFDPRKLPPLEKVKPSGKSQFELIATLISQVVFGVWWLVGLHYPFWIMGPGAALLTFGPVWHTIYPLFVLLVLQDAARTLIRIVRPQWIGLRVADAIMLVLGFAVLYFLITTPDLFISANPQSPQLLALSKTVNSGLHIGLMLTAVIKGIKLIVDASKFAGRRLQAHQAIFGSLLEGR